MSGHPGPDIATNIEMNSRIHAAKELITKILKKCNYVLKRGMICFIILLTLGLFLANYVAKKCFEVGIHKYNGVVYRVTVDSFATDFFYKFQKEQALLGVKIGVDEQ